MTNFEIHDTENEQSSKEDNTMVELFKNLVAMTDKSTLNEVLKVYGKNQDDILTWLENQGNKKP